MDAHSLPPSKSQVFFGSEGRYTRMSSSLLSATVRRLLLDRIEATIYSWTVSGDSKNAAMNAHVATFTYLDVTKISIRQPCLNFAVYSSHMLLHRLRQLDVLLLALSMDYPFWISENGGECVDMMMVDAVDELL